MPIEPRNCDPIITIGDVTLGDVIVEPLTCDKDFVTICPGVEAIPIIATDLDVRNLLFLTDKIDVSGSAVSVSNFPASVEISNDTGNPLPVNGTVTLDAPTLAALESTTIQNPSGAGSVNIQDGGNSITIDGAVSVSNFPASVEISNDTGNPLPVSGEITATEKSLIPKGYQQISPVVSTALTIPGGAVYALLQARTADISYRDDGVAPTTSIGMRIITDSSLFYTGSLAALQVISSSGTLDILYYGII